MQNDDYIIEEFGKDIWLYLDNDLPSERMDYWNNQIQTRPEIQRVLTETQEFLTDYNNLADEKVDNLNYEKMVRTATKQERMFLKIKLFFKFSNESESLLPKMAFVTSLSIAALIILILSQKPNPVNKISSEFLDWDDEITTTQIQNISNSISLIENNDMQNYMLYKRTKVGWNRDVYNIENKIQSIDKKIMKTSL